MKDCRIEIRLTKEEYDRLIRMAKSDPDCIIKRSGKASISAYIRKRTLYSGDQPESLKKEMKDLTYQIRKIGVNINQAVYRINAGIYSGREMKELQVSLRKIEFLLREIQMLLRYTSEKKNGGFDHGHYKNDAH